MNILKKIAITLGLSAMIALPAAVLNTSSTHAVAITSSSTAADCSQRFLTFPTWFRGLVDVKEVEPGVFDCVIKSPEDVGGLSNFIWHIVLNVIEMGLQGVIYLTIFFLIWGGFQFLTSQGSPEAMAKARKTMLDAIIGLGMSFAAIAVVNIIFGIIK